MLRTKSIIPNITDVPRTWVFEYYLQLGEQLTGQDVKVKSPFSTDKVPSLCIYYSNTLKIYNFKDFSTGITGDSVTLIKHLFNLQSKGEAAHKILTDYNNYRLDHKTDYHLREFKEKQRYSISKIEQRSWDTNDQRYWTRYGIGSDLLGKYNVRPLDYYTMAKTEDGEYREFTIKGNYIYAYYRTDGSIYKLYQPYSQNKFIKIADYTQGTDQLTMKVPYLIICSSLKDIMGFSLLRYTNAEAVAPDSENCLLPAHIVALFKHKYKKICVLFDNDMAGKASMKKYKKTFGVPYAELDMSKDLTDSIRDHGVDKVRNILSPILKQKLNETT